MQKRSISYLTVWAFITRMLDLVGLFTAMYLSELLVQNIVFGGTVYIVGEVWVIYARLYNAHSIQLLPANVRNKGLLILIVAALLTAANLVFFPFTMSRRLCLVVSLLVAGFILQQMVTDTVAERITDKGLKGVLLLLLAHAGFLALYLAAYHLLRLLFGFATPQGIELVYAMTMVISVGLAICQHMDTPHMLDDGGEGQMNAVDADKLMEVHSYRIYNNMTVNALFAINLSVTAFICYMRFFPHLDFLTGAFWLCAWLVYIALVTGLFLVLLWRRYLPKYDRPAIVLAGLVLWTLATIFSLRDTFGDGLVSSLIITAMLGASYACMLSIILIQSYEIKTVIEIGVGHVDQGSYARNTRAMIDWSALLSYLLMLLLLTIASFVMDGRFQEVEAVLGLQEIMRVIMLVLPMIFVMVAMVFSLLQPLDRQYAEKLMKYTQQLNGGKRNKPMEERLKKILVANYPRLIAVTILKPILRPFFPCKVRGQEHVDLSDGPVVFVCNHLELYGPMVAVLHSPFYFRPWIIQSMLDRDIIADQMRGGAAKVFGFLPEKARDRLVHAVSPVVLWIMRSTDPIPVFRGTVRGVIQTIHLSVEAMDYDDNILIFPEIDYQEQGVGAFFTGFVQVAKSYHKQTGKCTSFYPMYIDKARRTMRYGEGVRYDPTAPTGEEKERIVNTLQSTMNAMARGEDGTRPDEGGMENT
ncbi:hypothetical protein LJC74_00800 [Eubacteriales bacterium OttesenSCG-928-A19]|nr:hypothetical protein [Eubacteriales bacterium OttesenSCG-928-A19]